MPKWHIQLLQPEIPKLTLLTWVLDQSEIQNFQITKEKKSLRTCFFKRQFLSPPKNSVSPSRGSAFVTCIVSLWPNVIFICWSKINSPFMEVFKNLRKEVPSPWMSYRWGRCYCALPTFLWMNNILIFKQKTTFTYYKCLRMQCFPLSKH